MRAYRMMSIVLVGFMLSACSLKNPSHKESAENPHQMGDQMDVRYYALGGKWMQKIAHHTYPEAFDANGTRYAWKALGGDSGGDILADTTTKCDKDGACIDLSTLNYIMTEAPCIWPYEHYYAIVGVCWNATNRGLYYTGKTVHNVPFYALIEKVYGTYGLDTNSACWYSLSPSRCEEGKKRYAWSQCLTNVQEKMPWSANNAINLKSPLKSIDPRIELYHNYTQQSNKNGMVSSTEEDYLKKLFELNIKEKLGDISQEQKATLFKIDKQYRIKRASSDKAALTSPSAQLDFDALNQLFNEELKEYQNVLSDEEYLKLFGASKSEIFDIRNQ
ncbi:hypothetical protein [Sulfurospirillum halorespirans]|uniref:Lipoprotein n=1 Tax=Sulfurospirillum halorespirans DSM 13726 TaxID=1193502 RepID=A0A1D7TJ50_9BACT|nr:hypothetical protein [Sulfurospirillum halorespirans]AOO65003.1 hypothetical protein SHALO_1225 [Sulfurospirillum halorespirans DSM 13726]